MVKELKAGRGEAGGSGSEPWGLEGSSVEEIAAVMPALSAVLEVRAAEGLTEFAGRKAVPALRWLDWPNRAMARWMVRVAAAAPSLPAYGRLLVAAHYHAWEVLGEGAGRAGIPSPHSLDVLLACRPWEAPWRRKLWLWLVESGAVDPVPYALALEAGEVWRRRLPDLLDGWMPDAAAVKAHEPPGPEVAGEEVDGLWWGSAGKEEGHGQTG
jgi:hypothetical protein